MNMLALFMFAIGLLIAITGIALPAFTWMEVSNLPLSIIIDKYTVQFWSSMIFSSPPFVIGVVLLAWESIYRNKSFSKYIIIAYMGIFWSLSLWLNYSSHKEPDPFWGLFYFAYAFMSIFLFLVWINKDKFTGNK